MGLNDPEAIPRLQRAVDLDPQANASTRAGTGLYIGCGNGRNYLPLVDAGLNLLGLDVSAEAIKRLSERRPATAPSRPTRDAAPSS